LQHTKKLEGGQQDLFNFFFKIPKTNTIRKLETFRKEIQGMVTKYIANP
jgi:hypothetical protein